MNFPTLLQLPEKCQLLRLSLHRIGRKAARSSLGCQLWVPDPNSRIHGLMNWDLGSRPLYPYRSAYTNSASAEPLDLGHTWCRASPMQLGQKPTQRWVTRTPRLSPSPLAMKPAKAPGLLRLDECEVGILCVQTRSATRYAVNQMQNMLPGRYVPSLEMAVRLPPSLTRCACSGPGCVMPGLTSFRLTVGVLFHKLSSLNLWSHNRPITGIGRHAGHITPNETLLNGALSLAVIIVIPACTRTLAWPP